MAKIIKSSKRRTKKGGKSKTVTKTVTKKVYVKAKKAGRKFKKAAGQRVNFKDAAFAVAGAGVGAVGGSFVITKIPETVPAAATNAGVAVLGAAVALFGMKKRNKALMGAGLGMGAVGVRGLVANVVPTMAGYDSLPAYTYTPALAAPLAAPFAAPFAGSEEMAAPFDGDNDETI